MMAHSHHLQSDPAFMHGYEYRRILLITCYMTNQMACLLACLTVCLYDTGLSALVGRWGRRTATARGRCAPANPQKCRGCYT